MKGCYIHCGGSRYHVKEDRSTAMIRLRFAREDGRHVWAEFNQDGNRVWINPAAVAAIQEVR